MKKSMEKKMLKRNNKNMQSGLKRSWKALFVPYKNVKRLQNLSIPFKPHKTCASLKLWFAYRIYIV